MKFENFKKAKSLVEEIEKKQNLLNALGSEDLHNKISKGYHDLFMTIGAWLSCEHECSESAVDFILTLKMLYEKRLEKLHKELELM